MYYILLNSFEPLQKIVENTPMSQRKYSKASFIGHVGSDVNTFFYLYYRLFVKQRLMNFFNSLH